MKPTSQEDEDRPTPQGAQNISHAHDLHAHEPLGKESMPIVDSFLKPKSEEWDIYRARIIPVPADGLCMYHCVHAANDPNWVEHRHECGMATYTEREKADEVWAQAPKTIHCQEYHQ